MARLKEIYIKSDQPFERGRQHGAQAREEILRARDGYEPTFERKGYTWDEAVEMALRYVPFLEREMPGLMEEARGIAEGAGVDLGLVMVLNTRYELLKFKKGVDNFENNECTCFCVTPEAAANGHTYAGQNWDNHKFMGENLYLVHIDECNGNRIVGLTEPAQLIRNGMNSSGISVNCSTLLSTLDYRGVAVPTNFMRRRLLQCRTLKEARELLNPFKPCISLNYVIGSAADGGVVYETNPREHFTLEPHRGIVTQGNDFQADPSIDRFVPADPDHVRHFRGQRLYHLLGKRRGSVDEAYLKECLRDHYGYPGSICNHAAGLNTIASIIYCLDQGYAWISWGNPCEQEYEKYEL